MANPRQRRKLRSGSHTPVKHSRRAKTLLKKQPAIRGPKVLQDAWDARKTVRQNYEAMGLAASLNPIASGGVEKPLGARAENEEPEASTSKAGAAGTVGTREGAVPKGYGRIVRDAAGNVVDVVIGEDEDEEDAGEGEAGAGGLVEEDGEWAADSQLAGWVEGGADRTRGGGRDGEMPEVVQALERLSETRGGPVRRHTSKGELGTLCALVSKHGEDVEAMARDRKTNVEQRTAGELRRAIRQAGGTGKLLERARGMMKQ